MIKNKKNSGSALVDYVVPTALVAIVVGLGIYGMFSSGTLLKFFSASGNIQYDAATKSAVIQSNVNNSGFLPDAINNYLAGELGGTPENPITKCIGGECSIDFGNYILNGVPDNFAEYVEASSNAGATEYLASLLDQIASQAEVLGEAEAGAVKQFATTGHNLALLEKSYEEMVNACNLDMTCVQAKNSETITMPAGFDETYYSFTPGTYADIKKQISIGLNTRMQILGAAEDLNNPSDQMINQYKTLMASSLSDSTKGILQEVYYNIGMLSEDLGAGIEHFGGTNASKYNDPLSGAGKDHPDLADDQTYTVFTSYKPSSLTHLNAGLACGSTNYYSDTGTKCH